MSHEEIGLCIHGHFYQPPREDPWIEAIEPQESAAPFSDWNERIHYECYLPNTKARVLDDKGNILDIVNNFAKISFDFGPTLMSWIEKKHPETYRLILDADRISCREHRGHGNAMAQVYNHMIMPLASRRDKATQVQWGREEFRRRFGRDSESIWLPETACNEETLEVLVEAGIRYIILEPHQAEAVRPLDKKEWQDVSQGQIDPKQPYRIFLKDNPQKSIDVFFYDGPVSRAIGFEDILFDAKKFMHRLEEAKQKGRPAPQLIHVATDGETYGHHRPFGDRVLAYLVNIEAPKKNFRFINYGEFLELNPPQFAVRLKEGADKEGTSWSCPHGVKRWKEHCGCRGNGPTEWRQHWRKPLRGALDWLRDELAKIYEQRAGVYLKDVWAARNDYIRILLDRSEENAAAFFKDHAKRELAREERISCLKLLEIQRHAMLMYASCGWFFTELSGIETVQVIAYAARALQLAEELAGEPLEENFLARLSEAKSNIAEFKDGRVIYEKWIRPRMTSLHHAAGFYAITSILDDYFEGKEKISLYCFKIHVIHQRKESFGGLTLNFGRIKIVSGITLEAHDLIFIALHIGVYDFRCSVKAFENEEELERLEKEFFDELHALHIVELLRKMDIIFGPRYYALKDLPLREKAKIISILTREVIEKISNALENLYDENRRMNEIYRSINLPIPEQIRYAAEHTLERRLKMSIMELAGAGFNPKKAAAFYRLIDQAKSFGVRLPEKELADFLSREFEKRTRRLHSDFHPEVVTECMNIQKTARKMKIDFGKRNSQEHLFFLIQQWMRDPEKLPEGLRQASHPFLQLLADLQINAEAFKKFIQSGFSGAVHEPSRDF